VDAAIVFADILPVLELLGLELDFVSGRGPVIRNPVRRPEDVPPRLRVPAEEGLSFTLEAVRQARRRLDGRVPLIGFSGAPFTLACYAVEGGSSRDFGTAKAFMYAQPTAWHRLLELLAGAVGAYLLAQARAGAQALQLFDSWAGILSPDDYRAFALPYSRDALRRARAAGVPLIHFSTGTAGVLPLIREAGGEVIGVDWRADLAEAWDRLGPDVAIQGNLDPAVLADGPADLIRERARAILDRARGRPGHIFNLGHGVLRHTPVENVALLVDFVHDYGGRRREARG
jgi:uroporphyrinogen decarboxylase